jgi:ubiquinol-cytochrome c reductase cytochrome c subunit
LSWFKAPRTDTPRARTPRRRKAAGYVVVGGTLVAITVGYSMIAVGSGASASSASGANTDVAMGRSLFVANCSACHGLDAQGTTNVAPSLIGAGAAAVDFQMSTGRMPAKEDSGENDRKPVTFTKQQIYDIAGYIESLGGGPTIPDSQETSTVGADTALGQELFSTTCSQCHGFSGAGGALTYGATAPPLTLSTNAEIYEAMLTGPEAMPVFGDGTITPAEKRDIIAYIQQTKTETNPGGFSLGRIGTTTEGLVSWLAGIGFLVFIAMWITARRRDKVIETEHG